MSVVFVIGRSQLKEFVPDHILTLSKHAKDQHKAKVCFVYLHDIMLYYFAHWATFLFYQ